MPKSFRSKVSGGDETLAQMQARQKIARRGKSSEKEVEAALVEFKAKYFDFDFDRLPDSRAAGGTIAAQVSDFLIFYAGGSFTLEVKEVSEGMRLKKFTQLPRMRRRQLAGCQGIVLVHFVEQERWVLVPISTLEPRDAASWDLSDRITFRSAKDVLHAKLFGTLGSPFWA